MVFVLMIWACARSFYIRMKWHNVLVAPGSPAFNRPEGGLYLRTLVPLTLIGIWWIMFMNGDLRDPLGPGMREWVRAMFFEQNQSFWGWFGLWACVYFVAALPKEATFKSALYPGLYADQPEPELVRINMRNSLIWNTIFYAMVFLNPKLPFGHIILHALKGEF